MLDQGKAMALFSVERKASQDLKMQGKARKNPCSVIVVFAGNSDRPIITTYIIEMTTSMSAINK